MVLTVDEVKQHLRIEYDEEDELIEKLILQAQAAAEDFCRVSFEKDVPEPVRLACLRFVRGLPSGGRSHSCHCNAAAGRQ